jgi:hypothetical protein
LWQEDFTWIIASNLYPALLNERAERESTITISVEKVTRTIKDRKHVSIYKTFYIYSGVPGFPTEIRTVFSVVMSLLTSTKILLE